MTWLNTAIDLALCSAVGLFVGAFAYVCMVAFNILSPSKRVADGRARFDVPQAEKLDVKARFDGDAATVNLAGVYCEHDKCVGCAVKACATPTETRVGNARSADVLQARPTHCANRFSFHEPSMSDATQGGQGQ